MISKDMLEDIIRLKFIENISCNRISKEIQLSRQTVQRYIAQFRNMVSETEITCQQQTYRNSMKRKPFPAKWNKYINRILRDNSKRSKTILTKEMIQLIHETSKKMGTTNSTEIYYSLREDLQK